MHSISLPLAGVFGLGGPEVLLVFAVLLLLFGGSKLPELAKGLGKSIKEFKHASREDVDAPSVAATPVPAATPALPAPAASATAPTAAAETTAASRR